MYLAWLLSRPDLALASADQTPCDFGQWDLFILLYLYRTRARMESNRTEISI